MIHDLLTWQQDLPDTIKVRVTPKAKQNRVKIEHQSNGERLIKIYVTAPAEDGKANQAMLELLAKELGLRPSALEIIQGLTFRDKVVRIAK